MSGNQRQSDTTAEKESSRVKPNSVYLWKGYLQPLNVISYNVFAGLDITGVSIGKGHVLFLTSDGEVYSQGSNAFGQLGLGSLEIEAVQDPVKISDIKDCIIQVACGKHHNAVVTSWGQALCWGDSRDGQCGTGSLDLVLSPTPVIQDIQDGFCRKHGLPKPTIHMYFDSVACGEKHTLAVSTGGDLWSWGCGKPLGLGELLHAPVPRKIDALKGKNVVGICCGEQHSLALIAKGEKSKLQSLASHPKTSTATPQTDVVEKHNISLCSLCQKEMFTFKDMSDMCIIETNHDCDNTSSVIDDSTLVDDSTFSSFSSPHTSNVVVSGTNQNPNSASDSSCSSECAAGNILQSQSDHLASLFENRNHVDKESNLVTDGHHQTIEYDTGQSESPNVDSNRNESIEMTSTSSTPAGDGESSDVKIHSPPSDSLPCKSDFDVCEEDDSLKDDFCGVPDSTIDDSILIIPTEDEGKDSDILPGILKDDSDTNLSSPIKSNLDTSIECANENNVLAGESEVMDNEINWVIQVKSSISSSDPNRRMSGNGTVMEQEADECDNELTSVEKRQRSVRESRNSDEIVWKRQSACIEGDEKECEQEFSQSQVPRSKSPSTVSTKSLTLLNQTEAMEYLRKQFEDEEEGEDVEDGQRKGKDRQPTRLTKTLSVPAATDEGKDVSPGFTSTSSPSALVKSLRNRALSSFHSLSVFGTSSDHTAQMEMSSGSFNMSGPEERESDGDEVFSSPEGCSMINSVGSLTTEDNLQPLEESTKYVADSGSLRSIRSGTLVEWRREMSSVDVDMTSLDADNNPNNLRSLRTIELKRRNLSSSLSVPAVPDLLLSPHRPVITTTEVWAWGHNNHGQLGLGDTIDRSEPVWIKYFSGRNVKKLAAGDCHSLALNDNSQVYSWGSNSHGQLGQNKTTDVPTRIKFSGGTAVWDIAAGSQHSTILVDMSGFQPDVFYCGKQPREKTMSSLKKALEPTHIPSLIENCAGKIISLSAGGPSCACKVWVLHPPMAEALFELAATERILYSQLIKTSNLLLRPLRKSSFFASMAMPSYKGALQNMIASFGTLTTKVGRGVTDLTATIQHKRNSVESRLVCERREYLEVFRSYSHVFSDFLAIGGFDYCAKAGSNFFSEVQGNIQHLSDDKDKMVATSNLFLRAMRYPFYRLSAYSRIFSRMSEVAQTTEDKNILKNTMLDWDSLKLNLSSDHKIADATKTFWENTYPRLADAMRSPSRRVLKESKNHPLVLLSASRFSSALFVLFNDIFVYQQNTSLTSYPLETLWVEAADSEGSNQNLIIVTTPEERLELSAPNSSVKAEWLMSLQSAISKVLSHQKSMSSLHASGERFTPPVVRHASHIFIKQGIYKDANYSGTWLSGKVHGLGEMTWPDGSVFKGNFKRGLMHGEGMYTLVKGQGKEIQTGTWKDGKLNGQATITYVNGDIYEGCLRDGQRCGHGMLQIGCIKSNYASVYIGEWLSNLRHGYGVEDHILKGEKYMGWWIEDNRHGNGIVVTLDGMYFEGIFVNNKMTGFGVMISDDDTLYEGDFMGITHLSGKGTLTLPQGDKMEGSFSGSLNEGLKINGTFSKAKETDHDRHHHQETHRSPKSKYFGRLCVPADSKWTDIYSHIYAILGQGQGEAKRGQSFGQRKTDMEKAWEMVAVVVSEGLKKLKEQGGSKANIQRNNLQKMEIIPDHEFRILDVVKVRDICCYLTKAFESSYHPLGQLMNMLVDVFRASYIGVGAHPRLLHHAVQEIQSNIRRIYKVLRLLFPVLPENGYADYNHTSQMSTTLSEDNQLVERLEEEEDDFNILTAAGIIHPILLPKIYPPLIDLYALYEERNDDRYWERVTKLNRQGDVGLMAYLGIEQQFWLVGDVLYKDPSRTLSAVKDECYAQAVDQLQQLSTAFSPVEKLKVIKQAFNEITKTVVSSLGDGVMWCMDDLFPIFQFVVVRAKIHHLGAEIHMIEDLMEPHLEHGEYGLMFTTLKASYFQIQNEKMPHH